MPAAKEQWIKEARLPPRPSYPQMLEFFGIPPYSPDVLDENISKKRRVWAAKTSVGNAVGRQKAQQVVDLIHRISQAIKRGTQGDVGGGAAADIPESVFRNLEELWKIIAAYVFDDDYDGALAAAREAAARWGKDSDAAGVFAWVVATGADSGDIVHPALLLEGLSAAETAVRRTPAEPRNWESQVALRLRVNDFAGAVAAAESAERNLALASGRLLVLKARGLILVGQPERAMIAAVRAVHAALGDPGQLAAVRSQATALLVEWAARNLLPISSPTVLTRYVEAINAAAWCSWGVPEAEDMVRVHRMWASNAGQRVFTGSWKLRSFLAVCTGFISLPIHNFFSSEPAWTVLRDGLTSHQVTPAFLVVAGPQYVQAAHHLQLGLRPEDL